MTEATINKGSDLLKNIIKNEIEVARIDVVNALLAPKYLLKRETRKICAINPTVPKSIKRRDTSTSFKPNTLFVKG